jgi:predicted PurR-regulated permease PerM
LRAEQLQGLLTKFTLVIRATIKGDLFVALLQGLLGGLIFWVLGVGAPLVVGRGDGHSGSAARGGRAGLIWGPVAIYFLVTGAVWQGLGLVAYGMLAIVVVDNYLRPLLIGKDTKMRNYVVLISMLGGIATFGLNGLVIGPVIAPMFVAAWDIFSAARLEARSDATTR